MNHATATGFVICLTLQKYIRHPRSLPCDTGGCVQVGVGPGVHDDDVRPLSGGEDGRGARAETFFGGLGGRGRRAGTKVDAEAVAGPLGGVVHAELLREAEEGAQLGSRTQSALRISGQIIATIPLDSQSSAILRPAMPACPH